MASDASAQVSIRELAIATYCPRQLYHDRRAEEPSLDPDHSVIRGLATRYPELRTASKEALDALPIGPKPDTYRDRLEAVRAERPRVWSAIVDPMDRAVAVSAPRYHGKIAKLADLGGTIPIHVSGGRAPTAGVWATHAVRIAAVVAALSRDGERVHRGLVEYPREAVVREVTVGPAERRSLREALAIAETLPSAPPRTNNAAKCSPCAYRSRCGVETASLESRLPHSGGSDFSA